ncbi:EcsC family protein [Paludibacterium paludis]|uniref:EcsC family protein n=1 Tax=Paludibacterium paludis TaxID=1225769 RepID=A0A918UAB3_9NEIS|nr:EcsC family protein [Paludibacterium paludis]GGY20698.1 hypothetical protein GCM10011289_25400 [Paludibacterium paludis]
MAQSSRGWLAGVLDRVYDRAVDGIAGFGSAEALAHEYLARTGTLDERVSALIRHQDARAGAAGFLTGLGGLPALPVALPANLLSVMVIQVRMVAAIAAMGGHDLRDTRVKTLVCACLAGELASDGLKDAGMLLGSRFSAGMARGVAGKTAWAVNRRIGRKIAGRLGGSRFFSPWRGAPLFGGLLGGTVDAAATHLIGHIARNTFIRGA